MFSQRLHFKWSATLNTACVHIISGQRLQISLYFYDIQESAKIYVSYYWPQSIFLKVILSDTK